MVEILVIDGDRSGVETYLASPVGVCLACQQAPPPDILPVLTRFTTLLDKVVDRSQYVVRCDRRPLISEEIDEHIWDGQKIWDPEFSGDPVPSCRRPKAALVHLHIVELTKFSKSIIASPACHSQVFVVRRQIGVGSFVALRPPINARTLPW